MINFYKGQKLPNFAITMICQGHGVAPMRLATPWQLYDNYDTSMRQVWDKYETTIRQLEDNKMIIGQS